ncbi:hypothetical protein [Paludisphaera sp.]|uniref:hypothetical protein n=1 Tax=Paludisphaera sp. TaxID=2017432 RepID=UPI00301C9AE6
MKAQAAFRMLIALAAVAGLAGCRAAGSPRTNRPPAAPDIQASSFQLDEFVREHNRNARLIQTINAKPSITVSMASPEGGKPVGGGLDGRLLVSQPHDFKLLVQRPVTTGNVADIGSNEHEFWFWVKENADKGIYRCAYDDLAQSNLKATYQPDWIVTAMGLKPITREEAASARITPGDRPGLSVVKLPPSRDPAAAYVREMIVDEKANRLVGFRAYDRDGKTLLGEATIQKYYDVTLKADADAEPGTDPDATKTEAAGHIPDQFRLHWVDEKLTLDIAMTSRVSNRYFGPKINAEFSQEALAEFAPPRVTGYESIDLAELGRDAPRGEHGAGDTTVRESMPPPEPVPPPSRRGASSDRGEGAGVRLGPPVEIRGARLQSADEDDEAPRVRRSAPAPAPRRGGRRSVAPAAADSFLLPVDQEVIGPAAARPPRSPFQQAAAEPLIHRPAAEF